MKYYFIIICVDLMPRTASVDTVNADQNKLDPLVLFEVLRNQMSSNNLTFVVDCVQTNYHRYESTVELILKRIPIAYRVVQLEGVDFSLFIANYILHRLTTSGEEWFDIFLVCWDDGREQLAAQLQRRSLAHQLVEIFQTKKHQLGNVRWIFFSREDLIKSIQSVCGIVHVKLSKGEAFIRSESIHFIRKCGGRVVVFDYRAHHRLDHLLREPFVTNASIFKHEISFEQLGFLTVICELDSVPKRNFCEEQPQKEIFTELGKKVKLVKKKSTELNFGECIDQQDDHILRRGKCNGFLQDMQDRLFDVCAVNIYPTQNISMALDFTSSYFRFDQLTFFAPPAIHIVGSFRSISMPFQTGVWISIAFSTLISSIVLSLLTTGQILLISWWNHVYYVTMVSAGQIPLRTRDGVYRIRHVTFLLAALLLANSLLLQFYAAVLTSYRQHPPTTPVIDTISTLEKVLAKLPPAVNVAVQNSTKYDAILNPQDPSELIKLIRNHSTRCPTKHECVKLVTQRKHVLLATDHNLISEIGSNPKTQPIARAKDNINMGRYSLPIQKGSPIAKQMKQFNDKLFEGGIFRRIHDTETFRKKPTFRKKKPLPLDSELTVDDFKGSYFVGLLQLYKAFVLVSLATLLSEEVFQRVSSHAATAANFINFSRSTSPKGGPISTVNAKQLSLRTIDTNFQRSSVVTS